MADAPLDRDYTVGGAPEPRTCTSCGTVVTKDYGLVRRALGVFEVVCYTCDPPRGRRTPVATP